jgi:hypothetical protein
LCANIREKFKRFVRFKKQLLGEGAKASSMVYGGYHIMTMHGGRDETTMAVPGERFRLLQHRQCAFVSQFAQFGSI